MSEIMTNNPFASVGAMVEGDAFVGRESEIRTIKERLLGREFGNVSIIGIPKIGKSSLMQRSLLTNVEQLWENNRTVVVWYTMKRPIEENIRIERRTVFIRLVDEVYHALKRHKEYELIDLLKEYYDIVKEQDVVWSEFEQNILYFFEEIVYAKIRVIYCIDEFDYSKDFLGESEYELLREISYRNSNKIAIVTTSRRSIYDIEHYSGGGSNFFSTFENVYLKPFGKEEHDKQCSLASGINSDDITQLYSNFGGHPYLSALALKNFVSGKKMDDCISTINQEVLKYYADLFYVMEKDDLADKVDKLYCGFTDGVTESQEDYIYNCYGIFKEDADGYIIPFSTSFDNVLRQRYRENPFSLTWPEAERAIRKSISYAMTEEYGEENRSQWVEEIRDFEGVTHEKLSQWRHQMHQERAIYKARASDNIIDQLYPIDYPIFFKKFWIDYLRQIYGGTLSEWIANLNLIAKKVRNPEMHSRRNLVDPDDRQKANIICQEIIDCVKRARL